MSLSAQSPVIGRKPDLPSSIRMYPAGNDVYIAFCDDAEQPHYLEVAGTLYVFMCGVIDVSEILNAIASVLHRLTCESKFYGYSIDAVIEEAWVAQIVAIEPNDEAKSVVFENPMSGGE